VANLMALRRRMKVEKRWRRCEWKDRRKKACRSP
jgi:hypothetical protein